MEQQIYNYEYEQFKTKFTIIYFLSIIGTLIFGFYIGNNNNCNTTQNTTQIY